MLKDLFTEKDGISFCPVRAGFIIGFVLIIALTIRDVLAGVSFMSNVKDWVSSMGEYLGLGGAAIAGKNATEKE